MAPTPRDPEEVAAWLAKADGDLRMAAAAVALDDPLWDQACFHSQQASEKALKALFVSLYAEVPRTHDLTFLVERLTAHTPVDSEIAGHADAIGHFSVSPRYPSFLDSETEQDARDALSRAQEIVDWVKRSLR
jgi:HEPN domain-containing protein